MSRSEELARRVLALAEAKGVMIATAESCTGGLVAAALTAIPGSSAVVDRGFVTYSNQAKVDMLGVGQHTLDRFGAVSRETALEMAAGALARSAAGLAVSITGIAGPGGGSRDKPVGLVWFGMAAADGRLFAASRTFDDGGRDAIRADAAERALRLLADALEGAQAAAGAP